MVFGALTARAFRGGDGRGAFCAPIANSGWGTLYVDENLHTRRETLSLSGHRRAGAARGTPPRKCACLYVLLTRARRRLILVGSLRNARPRACRCLRPRAIFPRRGHEPSAARRRRAQRGAARGRTAGGAGVPACAGRIACAAARAGRGRRPGRFCARRWKRRRKRRLCRRFPGHIRTKWTASVPSNSQLPAFCANWRARGNCPNCLSGPPSCNRRA